MNDTPTFAESVMAVAILITAAVIFIGWLGDGD